MSNSRTSSNDQGTFEPRDAAVVLEPIERDRANVLNQLFELYAHDFSEYVPLELKESGRFEVSTGELWWTREDHHPFFLRADGRLVGFALVRRGSRVGEDRVVMDVAEFFVVRGERRRGLGHSAASALLSRFPGRWEVRVRHSNPPAMKFWSSVLSGLTVAGPEVSTISANDVGWYVLRAQVH